MIPEIRTFWTWVGKVGVLLGVLIGLLLGGCAGGASHLKRGDDLRKAGLAEEALTEYEQAAKAHPDDPEVAKRIVETKLAVAEASNEQGTAALQQKDFAAAASAFKKAIEYAPEERKYKENLKRAADDLVAAGKKAVADKKIAEGIALFKKVLQELPKYQPARDALNQAEQAFSKTLYEEAKGFEEHGLFGNALLSVIKLRKMTGAYADSAAIEVNAREKIQEAAGFEVAVKPGNIPKKYQEGTGALIQKLRTVKVPQCPSYEVASGSQSRVQVTVGLEEVAFSQAREPSTGKQKYQSGIKKVDNPKHQELAKKVEDGRNHVTELEQTIKDDEKALEELRQKFTDSGPDDDDSSLRGRLKESEKKLSDHEHEKSKTEDEIARLRETLSQTPKKLDEPVYDEHAYDVFKVTRTASAKVKASARGEGGVVVFNETVLGTAATSDTTNSAIPKFGVKADPLEFPTSDAELTEQAVADAAARMGDLLKGACKRWRDDVLARARQASTDAKSEAAEDFILYLFIAPEAPPPEALEFLKQQRDFTDIPALLGKENEKAKGDSKGKAQEPPAKAKPAQEKDEVTE